LCACDKRSRAMTASTATSRVEYTLRTSGFSLASLLNLLSVLYAVS